MFRHILFLGTLVAAVVLSNESMAADGCGGLLKHGIYDYFRDNDVSGSAAQMRSEVQRVLQQVDKDEHSGSLQASYGLFSGKVSLSASQLKSLNDAFSSALDQSSEQHQTVEKLRQTMNTDAITAWSACEKNTSGLQISTDFPDDPLAPVSFKLQYKAPPGVNADLQIYPVQITPTNAFQCVWTTPEHGTVKAGSNYKVANGNEIILDCTRNVHASPIQIATREFYAEPARITVNTDRGSESRPFAGYPAPKQPPQPSDILMAAFPSGVILPWYSSNTIPAGWSVCDGTNHTPDLRDKFIRGAADLHSNGTGGGSASHSHPVSVNVAVDGSGKTNDARINPNGYTTPNGTTRPPMATGFDHQHKFSVHSTGGGTGTASSEDNNSLPPFIRVLYIIKI